MEAVVKFLPVVLISSVWVLVLTFGLTVSMADATYLFRRPGRLLRSITAIEVVVPLVAALLVAALPLAPMAKLGVVLMAASPMSPLLPGSQLKLGGRKEYVYGLYVAMFLLAIVLVPLVLTILSVAFARDAWVAPAAVARSIVVSVLLPLGLGMLVRRLAPRLAERVAPTLSKVAGLFLLLSFGSVLILMWPAMRVLLGDGTGLVMAAVVASGFLAGHLLGGPDPGDRTALAVASATRNPGVALLIAKTAFPTEKVVPAIVLFLLIGILVSIPYQIWSKRRAAKRLVPVEA